MESEDTKGNVRAVAVCACGSQQFTVKIYSCGNSVPHCKFCDKAWSSPAGGQPEYPEGDKALAGTGDVGEDLVPQEEVFEVGDRVFLAKKFGSELGKAGTVVRYSDILTPGILVMVRWDGRLLEELISPWWLVKMSKSK